MVIAALLFLNSVLGIRESGGRIFFYGKSGSGSLAF
jgi:hypothetical protein